MGVSFAKGLAYANSLPLIPVHHIRGHIAANYTHFNGKDNELLEPAFSTLVMSGGHTSLINVNGYVDFECIGATRDDAVGEAFDKAARLMGLEYPGGAKLDALAHKGNAQAISFPVSQVKDCPYDFSFSGMKTAAINYLHTLSQKGTAPCYEDVAASFTKAVCNTIQLRLERLFNSGEFTSRKLVLGGGVAANSHIRKMVQELCDREKVKLFCAPKTLCGDNAVMIGAQGYYEYINKTADFYDYALNAYATSDVCE